MSAIHDYLDALERLRQNKPIIVAKGSPISNDTVALEAGRKRGSIKKSRPQHLPLIEAISEVTKGKKDHSSIQRQKIDNLRNKVNEYRSLYEESLSRQLMLLHRLEELETKLCSSSQ